VIGLEEKYEFLRWLVAGGVVAGISQLIDKGE